MYFSLQDPTRQPLPRPLLVPARSCVALAVRFVNDLGQDVDATGMLTSLEPQGWPEEDADEEDGERPAPAGRSGIQRAGTASALILAWLIGLDCVVS